MGRDAVREELEALADDLNLSAALAAVFGLVKDANTAIDEQSLAPGDADSVREALAEMDQVLGVLDPGEWTTGETEGPEDEAIEALVRARQAARESRDFTRADEIRDELAGLGIALEDSPQGTRWKRGS